MEILTYSLWFTLFWWSSTIFHTTTWGSEAIEFDEIIPHFIGIPAITILLEYLIMR